MSSSHQPLLKVGTGGGPAEGKSEGQVDTQPSSPSLVQWAEPFYTHERQGLPSGALEQRASGPQRPERVQQRGDPAGAQSQESMGGNIPDGETSGLLLPLSFQATVIQA